ncbi:MAG: TIM44-like domain-containing protein [Planctomycetes bacterium]|nr:TIM44-like domain-containing protein [Planctomycetota bacterium]
MRFRAFVLVLITSATLTAGSAFARGGDGGDYSGDGSSSGSSSSSGSDWGGSSSSSSDSDYSSGSSDYGESSGGGGGDVGGAIGLLVILGIFGFAYGATLLGKLRDSRSRKRRTASPPRPSPSADLSPLRDLDKNFSPVLFTAFAHLVYVKYHESRGGIVRRSAEEFAVAPYLNEKLRKQVRKANESISQVVVGDMTVSAMKIYAESVHLHVDYKSNVVYKDRRGRPRRMLLQEQLVFSRQKTVRTRKPEKVLALGCPRCGTKQEPDLAGRCPSCGEITGDGRMDWQVTAIRELNAPKPVKGSVAGGGGVEPGTDLPTVMDPNFKSAERELKQRDPNFDWSVFTARAHAVFTKLQEGWTRRDENILRPFELDHVYDTHRIWLERYREEGVVNVLKDIKIEYIKPVKIENDAWFDSITVRIRASMLDYKQRDSGQHLSGATRKRKVFTEYHTLVRRSTDRARKNPEPLRCPQCGAPLDKISQVGVCGYCDSRITTGEFDWVLAEITQDEEYGG